MSAEPAILPAWRKRGRTTVQQTVRTTYLRRDYNAADVALLKQIVAMQPRTFTFAEVMDWKTRQRRRQ